MRNGSLQEDKGKTKHNHLHLKQHAILHFESQTPTDISVKYVVEPFHIHQGFVIT